MARFLGLFKVSLTATILSLAAFQCQSQKPAPLPNLPLAALPNFQPEWVQDFPPFRLVGNLYYVGSYDLPVI